jgi:hypothetical protein
MEKKTVELQVHTKPTMDNKLEPDLSVASINISVFRNHPNLVLSSHQT